MKPIYFLINKDNNHESIVNSGSGASEVIFYLTAKQISEVYNVTIINRSSKNSVKINNIQYIFAG